MTLTVNPVTDLTVTDEGFSTNGDTVLNADISTNGSTTSGGSPSGYALDTDVSNGTLVLNTNGNEAPHAGCELHRRRQTASSTVTDADSGESSTGTGDADGESGDRPDGDRTRASARMRTRC